MIQDLRNYLNNLWSFNEFDTYLRHGCKFSDVDAVTERNGFLLFLETKNINARVPAGQKRMIISSTKRCSNIVWLVIWGNGGYISGGTNLIQKFTVYFKGIGYSFGSEKFLPHVIKLWQYCADTDNFHQFKLNVMDYLFDESKKIKLCGFHGGKK